MTLTEAAVATKKGAVWFSIFILACLIVFIIYQIIYNDIVLPHQKQQEALPTTKFGVLPQPALPHSLQSASSYSYTIDTETGDLPAQYPSTMNVYFVPQLGTTLLAFDRVKNLANSLGFTSDPTVVNNTQYHFTDSSGGELTIDLDTANFKFNRNVDLTNAENTLPDADQIASDFVSYLSSKGLMQDNLNNGRTNVVFEHSSNTDSDTATVSIWPNDIGQFKIVTPKYSVSNINALVTKSTDEQNKYSQMQYIYWNPDLTTLSTYPIKSPAQAFADLKSGKGVMVIQPENKTASITSVTLAYYEPDSYQKYLEPVYVFSGPDMVAYVPAITNSYLSPFSSP